MSDLGAARPNVVVFLTDQQRWDTCDCYGYSLGLTPNLDAVASEGVRFSHAFTPQPVCGPARACLQTGRYATEVGHWKNALELSPSHPTLADSFRAAGYHTGYLGKWHLANTRENPVPEELRGRWEHWEAADIIEFVSQPYYTVLFDNNNEELHLPGYRVDCLTDRAVSFLEHHAQEPFILFLSYLEPHQQNDMDRFVAPEGYAEKYAHLPAPPDLVGHEGDWPAQLADYYGMVARLDEQFGRLRGELEQRGLADNTIILFTSDHGCHFKTRNFEYKRSAHEASVRVPLVMKGPNLPAGAVVENPVNLLDAVPTLFEVCGLSIPAHLSGDSALALARGETTHWRDEVFIQISESECARALRTPRWKYCAHDPDVDPWQEPYGKRYVDEFLYDLENDPHEQENLIGNDEYESVLVEMRQRLRARMDEIGEPAAEICARP